MTFSGTRVLNGDGRAKCNKPSKNSPVTHSIETVGQPLPILSGMHYYHVRI
jgi:hypothetical protein